MKELNAELTDIRSKIEQGTVRLADVLYIHSYTLGLASRMSEDDSEDVKVKYTLPSGEITHEKPEVYDRAGEIPRSIRVYAKGDEKQILPLYRLFSNIGFGVELTDALEATGEPSIVYTYISESKDIEKEQTHKLPAVLQKLYKQLINILRPRG